MVRLLYDYYMIGTASSELYQFNTAQPPREFDMSNAWEINQSIPIKTPINAPMSEPNIKYIIIPTVKKEASGPARYLVEGYSFNDGGMATVYRGWDRKLAKYVAVKTLKQAHIKERLFRDEIELEAKRMAGINHPGIPEVYDFNIVKGPNSDRTPVMIMEMLTAPTLFAALDRKVMSPISLEEVKRILVQVASTIDFMTSNYIHHEDIESKHIFLTNPHVKIIDFASFPRPIWGKEAEIKNRDMQNIIEIAYQCLFPNSHLPDKRLSIEDFNIVDRFRYNLSDQSKDELKNVFLKAILNDPKDGYENTSQFIHSLIATLSPNGV